MVTFFIHEEELENIKKEREVFKKFGFNFKGSADSELFPHNN